MAVLFRTVRTRRAAILQLNKIALTEINNVLDTKVKPALVKSHERIVSNWKNKPGFAARKTIKPNLITVSVFPTGPNKKIWIFVDRGTRPHIIKAKGGGVLRFQTGYQPKTLPSPARTVSGGGRSTGPFRAAKQVNHPGSKARNFSKIIAEDIKPGFKREVENAFRRTSKKVEE